MQRGERRQQYYYYSRTFGQVHLVEELRDDLINNNWDIMHYNSRNPNYSLTMQKLFWWSCGWNEQQADLQEIFHSKSITQEVGGYL
jgi:hypothetical protein